ncbi:MAG: SIR2 family protein [Sedimentisphaerales bacterium]|nr:SIR2 family protein [Sedimentisphaerales bacterium]
MNNWTPVDKDLLQNYTRPVVHLRKQLEAGRLVLIFGTGLTQQVGIPSWNKLNDEIAADDRVQGIKLLGRPLSETIDDFLAKESRETIAKLLCGAGPEETITTQRLFECFKSRKYISASPSDYHSPKLDASIYGEWRQIIRDKLYRNAVPPDQILSNHTYLNSFLPIIQYMPLTVTYNFDDVIENAISCDSQNKGLDYRQSETVTTLQTLPRRKSAVIYHPNGYIPRNPMEEKGQEMVLSESEFANRMLELTSGQYNSLLHVLSSNTCLFIGLSLKDSILKNLLKQSAMVAPGNYHYYISYYEQDKNKPSVADIKSIEAANFETYNLRTLFLNNAELNSIAKLIHDGYDSTKKQLNNNPLIHFATENKIDISFYFYIVGSIGVGKSTCVSHLRNLITHDEWHEDRLTDLANNWKTLETEEERRKRVDKWIATQFKQKNQDLIDTKLGISISDRCPLDPICFTPESRWQEKAQYLLDTISPNDKEQIKEGHVIYLWDDPEHLEIRVKRSAKKYDKNGLAELQDMLDLVYKMPGMTKIDCRFQSFYEIMKRISRIIHMEPYNPAKIHDRLKFIQNNGLK